MASHALRPSLLSRDPNHNPLTPFRHRSLRQKYKIRVNSLLSLLTEYLPKYSIMNAAELLSNSLSPGMYPRSTFICAHTLSFRPIILPDTIVLRAGVPYDARTSSWASFDGRERVELKPGDYVTISASRFPFPSVLPLDRKSKDWIDSISRTLQWNSRQRQKSFKEWAS